MDIEPKIKTVRVRINVDEGASPRSRTGEMIHELVNYTKNLIPITKDEKSKKTKEK